MESMFTLFVLSNVIGTIMLAPTLIFLGHIASGVALGERLECQLLDTRTHPPK
jgi:hypothetical protein